MITVVIPTYKRPKSLKKLLKSIFNQTQVPDEIIIIDDCSNMQKEYKKVVNYFANSKIKIKYILNKKNMGAPYSRNYGIKKASNEWIALVDDDDKWIKKKLEYQKKAIYKNSENCDLITSNCFIKEVEGGKKIFTIPNYFIKNPIKYILQSNFIMSPTTLIRKKALLDVGLFDESLPSCQDWDLWTRIILKGYKLVVVKKCLSIYKKDNINSIGLSKNAKRGYRLFIRKNFKNIVKYTSFKNWIRMLFVYFSTFNIKFK